jgi:glutamine amidotransferase
LQKGKHEPVGDTDSEAAFCWLLNELDRKYPQKPADMKTLFHYLGDLCLQLQAFGIANILLSDGKSLFVYCSNTLHWITRRAPFGQAHLIDDDISIDFQKETTPNDIYSARSRMRKTETQ